jgi:hypothetical protein
MAARLNNKLKYYVYTFYKQNECVYVGKGCNNRFDIQSKRFSEFEGSIFAFFYEEKYSLMYEKHLIHSLSPVFNIVNNKHKKSHYEYLLLPKSNRDDKLWIELLGTKEFSARMILAKPWSILKKYGVDIKSLLNLVGSYKGEFYGQYY